jgi:hypothetical protein
MHREGLWRLPELWTRPTDGAPTSSLDAGETDAGAHSYHSPGRRDIFQAAEGVSFTVVRGSVSPVARQWSKYDSFAPW